MWFGCGSAVHVHVGMTASECAFEVWTICARACTVLMCVYHVSGGTLKLIYSVSLFCWIHMYICTCTYVRTIGNLHRECQRYDGHRCPVITVVLRGRLREQGVRTKYIIIPCTCKSHFRLTFSTVT